MIQVVITSPLSNIITQLAAHGLVSTLTKISLNERTHTTTYLLPRFCRISLVNLSDIIPFAIGFGYVCEKSLPPRVIKGNVYTPCLYRLQLVIVLAIRE